MTVTRWPGKRVLVTGASGFLGANVLARLHLLGAEAYGVGRTQHGEYHSRLLVGDLTDWDTVRTIVRNVEPDIVIHLAGQTNASIDRALMLPTFRGNLETTVNLLTALADVSCSRIILTGSLEEPETDGSDAWCTSPYALSKWGTVLYGRAFHTFYRLPVVIVRPFMTYGPRQRPTKLVPYVARSLLTGEVPRVMNPERRVDWIFVEDVVEGILAAATVPGVEGRTIDLGSGFSTSVRQVVTELSALAGATVRPQFEQGATASDSKERVANVDDAARWLKWKPSTSLRDGLAQTLRWYRSDLARASSG